jgi:deoxycytidine triphosphate deaminase
MTGWPAAAARARHRENGILSPETTGGNLRRTTVAKILPDREISKLIGRILLNADEALLTPNGIRLRLGEAVRFHSTGEQAKLGRGKFLKVNPGETVVISSLEVIDFTRQTVQEALPKSMLMGLITPTTTMMREGITQVATKIDAGFKGNLNWGLRNSSTKDLILEYGEPIFKLTLFLLEQEESPDVPYGGRAADSYQGTNGIALSARQIPADIPKSSIVCSSFDKLDHTSQLREAGYPFDHIGTELVALHGKFEVVSKDVMLLKDEFNKRTNELSEKIVSETQTVTSKVEEFARHCFERVEAMFNRKFLRAVGVVIAAIPIMYGLWVFLKGTSLGENFIGVIAVVAGIAVFLVTYLISARTK